MSKTKGSKLDIDVIIELEDVFYQIINQLDRWKAVEDIPVEIVKKIKQLAALSSSLVAKINRDKDTEAAYFDTAMQLGDELVKFSKNISVLIPITIWADIMMSN